MVNIRSVPVVARSVLVALCVLGVFLWAVPIPVHASGINPIAIRLYVVIPIVYAGFHFEAVWLFIAGARYFKKELRRAYLLFCIGLLLLAAAQLQQPLVGLFNALWWIAYDLILQPYVIACLCFMVASHRLARLLRIDDVTMNWWFSLLVVVCCVVVGSLLPVRTSAFITTPLAVHVDVVEMLLQLALLSIVLIRVMHIRYRIGGAYIGVMRWLVIAIAVLIAAQLQNTLLTDIGFNSGYVADGFIVLPMLASSLVFLGAGYAFWRVGGATAAQVKAIASPLNAVVFLESLITDRKETDRFLESIRSISMRFHDTQRLSDSDQVRLAHIFITLEAYLTDKEPLRIYDREEVHAALLRALPADRPMNHAFWQEVNRLTPSDV
jgi:hypothetical protein